MSASSDEELLNMATKYFYYKSQGSGSGSGITSKMDAIDTAELNRELAVLNDKIKLAQTEEETYNEIYLNNKQNPVKFGLFSNFGLRTTQDWILAYFYFSYIVFTILLIISGIRGADPRQKISTISIVIPLLGFTLFMGIVFTVAILNFA
jgi:hypothetical protein